MRLGFEKIAKPSSIRCLKRPGRRSFSGAAANGEYLQFSKSSLGFNGSFVAPMQATIRQLPEVETAWNQFPSSAALDNLNRAADVFASFNRGGAEHIAVSALKAECQQRLALYEDALHTLEEMENFVLGNSSFSVPNASEDILLAKAKVNWTRGEFEMAEELCNSLVSKYDDFQETYPATNLHMASAMTGKALAQLSKMKTLEEAFSVRDYFRVTVKFLERNPSINNLPLVAAHANCGVAEAVYNMFIQETNNVTVPMDAALKVWFQGVKKIEENVAASHLQQASTTLQATIQADLAWGVLNYETDRKDRLSKASEYAKKALEVLDSSGGGDKDGVRRVLTVVASCYQQAGHAVTAEGLFQSAVDRKDQPLSPLPLLELRESLSEYSKLCAQWDKRESDAARLQKDSESVDDLLPDSWRGKSGIHGSLWFWMPADFL